MSKEAPKGQALPEYLLTLAVLLLAARAGYLAWQHSLSQAEDRQAWTNSLPSP